jgi:hypothetical protein
MTRLGLSRSQAGEASRSLNVSFRGEQKARSRRKKYDERKRRSKHEKEKEKVEKGGTEASGMPLL